MGKKLMLLAAVPFLAAVPLGCADPAYGARQDHDFTGQVKTVGDPNHPDELPSALSEAYRSGVRRINIRPGTYNFSKTGHPLFNFTEWHDVKISGHSVQLISSETEWGAEIFHLSGCSNVQLEGFTLSQNWQTALQGRVSSVNQTGGHTECVWKPDPGYPLPDPGATHFNKGPNIVDPKTRLLKEGCGDEWDAGLSDRGDGSYRVSFARKTNLADGDFLVARGHAAPCKVLLQSCHNCVLASMIILRNAFASIMENEGGGNTYYDLHWQLGPKPEGAAEKPLVSCSVDGFHSIGAYPGPDIENCEFAGVLLDDCISVHGSLQPVKSSSGDTIVVDQEGSKLREGQPVRIGGPGFFANAFVKSIQRNADRTSTVTMDKSLNVPAGAMVSNPLWNGQSFKILSCHLGNTRSRGILCKADAGLIQDNEITGCGMSAISAGPEYSWKEGDYVKDLSIKNNKMFKNGFVGRGIAAIFVHGEGAKGNRNITIEGNTFDGNFSGDVEIQWTEGAVIRQNTFIGPVREPVGLSEPHSIVLNSSSDIQISRNSYRDPSTYRSPIVEVGREVDGVRNDRG